MRYVLVSLLMVTLITLLPGWITTKAIAAAPDKTPAPAMAKPGEDAGQDAATSEGKGEGKKEGTEGASGEEKGNEGPCTFGPIITDTAVPIDKGKFAVQPTFFMGFLHGVFNRNWQPVSAGGNFRSFQMYWKLTYGLMNNTEIYAIIPYIHRWAYDVNICGPRGERSASFGGLGDIDLTVKYRLLEEGPGKPTVSALFAVDFPTGHYRNLTPRFLLTDLIGGGTYVFTTGFNISKCLEPFVLYGNVWYSMNTAFTVNQTRVYPRDFVTVNLAGEYVLTKNKKWVALCEVTSFWDGGRLIGHKAKLPPQALISVLPAIEYIATEKLMLALGVNVDFAGKNYPAYVSPVFSMIYQF